MKWFSIKELTRTSTGLNNTPNGEEIFNLISLVDEILDPAREILGMPIIVSSGFRSVDVNKKVGGAKNSQHKTGQAVDIKCADNAKLFEILKKMNYDQLIDEFGLSWIHVSYRADGKNRKQCMRAVKENGKTVYKLIDCK